MYEQGATGKKKFQYTKQQKKTMMMTKKVIGKIKTIVITYQLISSGPHSHTYIQIVYYHDPGAFRFGSKKINSKQKTKTPPNTIYPFCIITENNFHFIFEKNNNYLIKTTTSITIYLLSWLISITTNFQKQNKTTKFRPRNEKKVILEVVMDECQI